ncbi:MAG: type II secretion system protein [Burkholderiales bacterium]|jgi:tight adherence protein B|nr:MAG: type II secretion system protein [Burkholderiales bacterium]
MVASLVLFFIALVLMLAAVLSMMRARRLEQIAKVTQRLEAVAFLTPQDDVLQIRQTEAMAELTRWLSRVGLQIQPGAAITLMALAIASGLGILKIWGGIAALIWWATIGTISIVVPQVRYRQKVNKMISQIPLFVDQVVRSLATGRNVEGAIKIAAEDLQEPLREVIMRAQKNVDLGTDLGDALRDAANFHDIKELHMLALAIHTSRVYGGSPRDMLESIVNLIRQREQMQRELRAMTGETRVSAMVLGGMPTAMALYMGWVNPTYIAGMWNDESGRMILLTAGGMQIAGAVVLWRMIKSI